MKKTTDMTLAEAMNVNDAQYRFEAALADGNVQRVVDDVVATQVERAALAQNPYRLTLVDVETEVFDELQKEFGVSEFASEIWDEVVTLIEDALENYA